MQQDRTTALEREMQAVKATLAQSQAKAAQTRSRNRFIAVLAMSVFVLMLALVPIGAMYATSVNLLADTGIDGVTNADLVDALWPVGSVYISMTGTNPGAATAFGVGTWQAWGTGRVPVGAGSNGIAGAASYTSPTWSAASPTFTTGGAESREGTVTALTINNIPYTSFWIAGMRDAGNKQNDRYVWPGTNTGIDAYTRPNTGSTYYVFPNAGNQTDDARAHRIYWGQTSPTKPTVEAIDLRQPYVVCYMWLRTK